MAGASVYLDTNVFIYAFENNDAVARKLLELFSLNAESKPPFLVTSEFALAELMVDPFRRNDERLVDIYDNMTIGNSFVQVGTVSRDVLWNAALLRAEHASLRLPDAIHLSTAMLFGCSHVLTGDSGLKTRYSIASSRRMQPQSAGQIAIIRPEVSVLDQLVGELS